MSIDIEFFVQVGPDVGRSHRPGAVALTQRVPENPAPGTQVVHVRLALPDNIFEPLEAVGEIPEDRIIRVVRVDPES